MPRQKSSVPTRQLYAQIREDLYLSAKGSRRRDAGPAKDFPGERAGDGAEQMNRAPAIRAEAPNRSGTTNTSRCRDVSRSALRCNSRRTRHPPFSKRR